MTSFSSVHGERWATSHYEVLRMYQMKYDEDIQNGNIDPVIYPMISYGIGLGLLFMLIPPQHYMNNCVTRHGVFGIILCFHIYLLCYCRAFNMVPCFGLGICYGWGTVWSAAILIFTDAKADTWRVAVQTKPLRNIKEVEPSEPDTKLNSTCSDTDMSVGIKTYYPQWCPSRVTDRLAWAVDLYTAFRGSGWSFEITSLPEYPRRLREDLNLGRAKRGNAELIARNGIKRFDSYWPLILHNLYLFFTGYIILDVLKTNANHDPYFWGFKSARPPSYYPTIILENDLVLRSYRLIASMCLIWIGLRTVFCMASLIFVGLLRPLGVFGTWHEPFLYPDHYGSFMCVLDRGLAGWWGGWWHQTFRYAFEVAAKSANTVLGTEPKSTSEKIVTQIVAFALSGFIHACGAYSLPGSTNPVRGSFAFFMLQPVGLLLEEYWRKIIQKYALTDRLPTWLARLTNFAWVFSWFVTTGPLMMDDLTAGVWLSEPVMISPLRGLGFGVPGDGWFCWDGEWMRPVWFGGKRWWLSGIAL